MAEATEGHNEASFANADVVLQAHTILGGVHIHPTSHAAIPRQLPAPPRSFTGRGVQLAALTEALDHGADRAQIMDIFAIGGAGGIGKTWLALHWAHEHAERFPDGHLFADLRGFAPNSEPVRPGQAIQGFLDALGVEPRSIPVDLDARVGLYRSVIAGRRILIVLDNARDTTQVTPLLPGSPTCTVLVTSRERLTGLVTAHGAKPVPVDVLGEADARALLAGRLGERRLAAEPAAVAEILDWCAGFPLALSIVASRAANYPAFPLSVLAAELQNAATRLAALDGGDPAASVRTVLSWSYAGLASEHARVFGLLGLAPGPDISVSAVANLVALPGPETETVIRDQMLSTDLHRQDLVHNELLQALGSRYRRQLIARPDIEPAFLYTLDDDQITYRSIFVNPPLASTEHEWWADHMLNFERLNREAGGAIHREIDLRAKNALARREDAHCDNCYAAQRNYDQAFRQPVEEMTDRELMLEMAALMGWNAADVLVKAWREVSASTQEDDEDSASQ